MTAAVDRVGSSPDGAWRTVRHWSCFAHAIMTAPRPRRCNTSRRPFQSIPVVRRGPKSCTLRLPRYVKEPFGQRGEEELVQHDQRACSASGTNSRCVGNWGGIKIQEHLPNVVVPSTRSFISRQLSREQDVVSDEPFAGHRGGEAGGTLAFKRFAAAAWPAATSISGGTGIAGGVVGRGDFAAIGGRRSDPASYTFFFCQQRSSFVWGSSMAQYAFRFDRAHALSIASLDPLGGKNRRCSSGLSLMVHPPRRPSRR